MEANTASTLLALPVELVTHITNLLDKEHLLIIRSTCKALDAIVFDRFAEEYFAHLYCWIAATRSYERLRKIMAEFSRLRDRIGQITFTANILEDQSVNAVNVVCKQAQAELQARKGTMQAIYGSEPRTLEDSDLIQRTLLDIQCLRQSVSVNLDLTGMVQLAPYRFDHSYGAILSAMAATHTQVRELTTFGGAFAYLLLDPNYNYSHVVAALSTITSFAYSGIGAGEWRVELPLLHQILQSAKGLRHLELHTNSPVFSPGYSILDIWATSSLSRFDGLLVSNDLSSLTSLHIECASINAEFLQEVLMCCQGTLTRFVLRNATVHSFESPDKSHSDGWVEVLTRLVAMPRLTDIELVPRLLGPFEDHGVDATMWEDVRIEGKHNIENSLHDAIERAPYVFREILHDQTRVFCATM